MIEKDGKKSIRFFGINTIKIEDFDLSPDFKEFLKKVPNDKRRKKKGNFYFLEKDEGIYDEYKLMIDKSNNYHIYPLKIKGIDVCETDTWFNDLKLVYDGVFSCIKEMFNYEKFSKKEEKGYSAYDLFKNQYKKQITTCSYCQLHYCDLLFDNDGEILRPDLDHFIPQSEYPFFAISIGNLVPCCSVCNSRFKLARDPLENRILNPVDDESEKFEKKFDLVIDAKPLDVYLGDTKDAKVSIEFDKEVTDSDKKLINNSIDAFKIKERYGLHMGEIIEIVKGIQKVYGKEFRDLGEMLDEKQIHTDYEEYRLWVEQLNFIRRGVTPSNYKSRIMGKMILDLNKKYGMKQNPFKRKEKSCDPQKP